MNTSYHCRLCSTEFSTDAWDLAFYAKLAVPVPTLCPDCRQQHRIGQMNQIHLFKRTCDATGKSIVCNFPPESPAKVYAQPYWHSDAFDSAVYGRAYDPSRPFFDQLYDLSRAVPRPALFNDYLSDENSEYTNCACGNKNCYMLFDGTSNEDVYYSYGVHSSRSCLDCFRSTKLELCYEAVDCTNCYHSGYLANCENCIDSYFLRNCVSCKSCFMCSNLRHKEFYVLNKPVAREEYLARCADLLSHEASLRYLLEFEKFRLKFPQPHFQGFRNENVTGNCLTNCKDVAWCFDALDLHDAKYCTQNGVKGNDFMDTHECGGGELIYFSNNLGIDAYHIRFSHQCLNSISYLTYCNFCYTGKHLFGCIGLKNKSYCILNKQYGEEAYHTLTSQIISDMQRRGEWGEPMPLTYSLFPYNVSVAKDYFPLSEGEAKRRGLMWHYRRDEEGSIRRVELPDRDDEFRVDSSLSTSCQECGNAFKVIGQERELYRKIGVALPRQCFLCRHSRRLHSRPPRKLWRRQCDKCSEDIQTAYAPEKRDTVYCTKCYLESLE